MEKGKFIVIEGLDGTGKQTQTQLLLFDLKAKGIETAHYSFPQYETFFGDLVSKYLKGEFGSLDEVPIEISTLLYELDRFQSTPEMFEKLESGIWIASDRYATSNLGYQPAKFTESNKKWEMYEWIKGIQKRLPKPDRILFLDVDTDVSGKLLDARGSSKHGDGKKDIHEENRDYMARVEDMFRDVAKVEEWIKIPCIKDGEIMEIEEIHERVMENLDDLIEEFNDS